MKDERQKQQRVVDTHNNQIKLKKLKRKGGSSDKVDTTYLSFCACF
jgi:hypothetical protein